MVTTYTTSTECAKAAGINTLTANSYPNEGMIDSFREDAYNLIGFWIGKGTTDSNGVAETVERQAVAYKINMVQLKQAFQIQLTQPQIDMLLGEFGVSRGTCFEPDQDGAISG